nr:ATP-binding protein [Ramlibacter aurantiacus]
MAQLADVVIALVEARRNRSRHEVLGQVLDHLRASITVLDAQTHRHLHANTAALQETGHSLEQLRALTPPQVLQGLPQARFEAAMQRLHGGARQAVEDYSVAGADGRPIPMETRWEKLEALQRELVVGIGRDISERKALERMKDELVSLINHELRTPLTSIRGAVKLLESGAAGPLPDAAAKLIGIASQSTDRLLAIVGDLLDLDRLASQQMTFRLDRLDAAAVLAQAAQLARPLALDAQVRLDVQASPRLLLRADAQRLQQVIDNLVSNAIKFAPNDSAVTLAATREDGGWVRLAVTDRGPGVPESFRSRIFQRFAQADARTTRAKGGSGLGLSIAKQMTEQMGGRIGFDSEPGRTSFHLTFPEATP